MKERSRFSWFCSERVALRAHDGQLVDFVNGAVRQGVHLGPGPEILDGIQFRRICGKKESVQVRDGCQPGGGGLGPVRIQPVPEQTAVALQFPVQSFQKCDHAWGIDIVARIKAEVQPYLVTLGRNTQSSQGRNLLVVTAALVEHGGLSAGRPTASHEGREQKTALIQKHQPGRQPACFFLMAGHTCLIHWRIPSSSRSTALRVGFCGLQFMECKRRQT